MNVYDIRNRMTRQVSNNAQALSGTTAVNGDSLDCKGGEGLVQATCKVSAATGSPTSQSHTYKLQESADDSTWSDVADGPNVTEAITADKGEVCLQGLRTMRYCRVVCTPSFVGGTSPANVADSVLMIHKKHAG